MASPECPLSAYCEVNTQAETPAGKARTVKPNQHCPQDLGEFFLPSPITMLIYFERLNAQPDWADGERKKKQNFTHEPYQAV